MGRYVCIHVGMLYNMCARLSARARVFVCIYAYVSMYMHVYARVCVPVSVNVEFQPLHMAICYCRNSK